MNDFLLRSWPLLSDAMSEQRCLRLHGKCLPMSLSWGVQRSTLWDKWDKYWINFHVSLTNKNIFGFYLTNVCWTVSSPLFSSVAEDFLKCLYQNGQCQHFCDGSGVSRKCFCAHGYMLAPDGRQCIAEGTAMIVAHFNHCNFRFAFLDITFWAIQRVAKCVSPV